MNIQLLFDIAVLKILGKFQEKYQWWSSYCIFSNKHPRRLLNFETERFLLEGGLYSKVSGMNNIINIKTSFFFKIRMKHTFSLSLNHYIIKGKTVLSIFADLKTFKYGEYELCYGCFSRNFF